MSNEKQVNAKTPPCFLVHSTDDKAVPPENSLMFAASLTKSGVPFGMVMLEKGGHGYGLGAKDPVLGSWPVLCTSG